MTQRSNPYGTSGPMAQGEERGKLEQGLESAKEKVSQAAGAVSEQAKHLGSQAKEQATHALDVQKGRASGGLHDVAEALRSSSRNMEEGSAHDYLERAADQVERLSGWMSGRSIQDMVGEVERFARREPALFLGGAFVVGLVGARFLKASGGGESRGGDVYRGSYQAKSSRYETSVTGPSRQIGTTGMSGSQRNVGGMEGTRPSGTEQRIEGGQSAARTDVEATEQGTGMGITGQPPAERSTSSTGLGGPGR